MMAVMVRAMFEEHDREVSEVGHKKRLEADTDLGSGGDRGAGANPARLASGDAEGEAGGDPRGGARRVSGSKKAKACDGRSEEGSGLAAGGEASGEEGGREDGDAGSGGGEGGESNSVRTRKRY